MKMVRAKKWSPEVEEAFRLQSVGYKTMEEYVEANGGEPLRWENGYIRKLVDREGESFTYWRKDRECEDKYLHKVKLYTVVEP